MRSTPRDGARLRQDAARACRRRSSRRCPACPTRRARTLPAAALVLDRVLKRLEPERVVFSALGLREGWLYSAALPRRALSRPAGRRRAARSACRSRACRDFAPGAGRLDGRPLPRRDARRDAARVAVCALSDIAWRDHPDFRAEESFRRLLQFPFIGIDHAERVFIAAAIHARYAGKPDAAWLQPAIGLLSPALRRRAQILGRALRLAYRFSGVARSVLATARLVVEPDCVKLEVASLARAPDSEVVYDRLALLAAAIGVRGYEIIVIDKPRDGPETRRRLAR